MKFILCYVVIISMCIFINYFKPICFISFFATTEYFFSIIIDYDICNFYYPIFNNRMWCMCLINSDLLTDIYQLQ